MAHTPAGHQSSCEAVLFSVGTSVSVDSYDSMAAALVKRGFVVAIVDPEKGWPTKLNVEKLREAYAHAKDNIVSWSDGACGSVSKWLLGGRGVVGQERMQPISPRMPPGGCKH